MRLRVNKYPKERQAISGLKKDIVDIAIVPDGKGSSIYYNGKGNRIETLLQKVQEDTKLTWTTKFSGEVGLFNKFHIEQKYIEIAINQLHILLGYYDMRTE
jgi:hypothetical protein